MNKDSIHFPDSLKYRTLVRSRVVYGGGGIMPDLFIPMDTTYYSDFYRDLIRKGILNQFVLTFVDNNRSELLSRYPTIITFSADYEVTDGLFRELIQYSKNQNLIPEKEELALSGDQIMHLMKAYIARDLWGTNEFYQILNQNDPKFLKSIQVLENWERYQVLLQNSNSSISCKIPDDEDQNFLKVLPFFENRSNHQMLLAESPAKCLIL